MSISPKNDVSKEVLLKRIFTDHKNYPYGFSRSGDFSIAESRALSAYGCLIAALVDGHLAPVCDEDKAYIESAHCVIEPQNVEQRAWLKYQQRINRPKAGSIYGTKKSIPDGNDNDLVSDIDDFDLDIDD